MMEALYAEHFLDLSEVDGIDNLFTGEWVGRTYPEGADINVTLKGSFRRDHQIISGYVDVNDEGALLRIELRGGIIQLPYIVLDYLSTDPSIVNYGRIMYKIEDDCTALRGRILGFSGERDFLVVALSELFLVK
jgi:hypothetical protein